MSHRFAAWFVLPLLLSALLMPVSSGCTSLAADKSAAPAAIDSEAAPPELVQVAAEVSAEVEAMRGWKFKQPVKTAVCSPEQVRAYMVRQIDKEFAAARIEEVQAGLRMVGLIPPQCELRKTVLDLLENQAEGFYDPDTKTLYMVKRKNPDYKSLVQRIMIAHELTHALDDQYVDLKKLLEEGERTEDRLMARHSVAEGSATVAMVRYMIRAQAAGKADMAELQKYSEAEAGRNKVFLDMPPYFQTMLASYVCGMNFLSKGNFIAAAMPGSKDVGEEVLAAAKDPPNTTHEILHPETYWVSEKRELPVIVSDKDMESAAAPGGYRVVGREVFGEMNAAVLTAPRDRQANQMLMSMPTWWTNPTASGWAGDRFFFLAGRKSGSWLRFVANMEDTKGVWVTFWKPADARDKFLQAYDACVPPDAAKRVAWKMGGRAAVFFYGFTETERADAQERLDSSPPKCTRGDKPWKS